MCAWVRVCPPEMGRVASRRRAFLAMLPFFRGVSSWARTGWSTYEMFIRSVSDTLAQPPTPRGGDRQQGPLDEQQGPSSVLSRGGRKTRETTRAKRIQPSLVTGNRHTGKRLRPSLGSYPSAGPGYVGRSSLFGGRRVPGRGHACQSTGHVERGG